MQGLPEHIDLSNIVGRQITMVRLGLHQLHYFLNDEKPNKPDVWVEIESTDIMFIQSDGKATAISDYRTNAGLLCLLLGLTIESATRTEGGGLVLGMSSGIRLEISIHTSMYESIVLHIGSESIVG